MAPSAMEARLARLRAVIKDDLEKLPNLPPKAEPKPEATPAATLSVLGPAKPEVMSHPKPVLKPNVGAILWPDARQSDSDSDDSEADCEMEFIRVEEDEEKIKELEKEDSSGEDNLATVSTIKEGSLAKGQLAPLGQGFTAIVAFSKFPYRYIPKDESENVADLFFNGGKFFMREWDLYYVWPLDYSDKPLVLISEEQFVQLVKEINTQFPRLCINPKDPYYREIGLTCDFNSFKHPRFLPRYLGRCKSRDEYDHMVSQAPDASLAPDDRSTEAFRAMVENTIAANKAKNKAKNKASKEARQVARVVQQRDMGEQLKRAQCYLGVYPRKEIDQAATASEVLAIPSIEHDEPVPYPFESAPVFICIDVEAFERTNTIITEIGVATLDTLDLDGVAPGVLAKNWQQKIRARHFRINEHTPYRNGEFVSDAAEQFEFGDSEFIALEDAPAVIESCFRPPFSKPDGAETSPESKDAEEEVERNIIFVAHDVNSDIQFLRQVRFDPLNLPNLLETLDTALLYRAHKRDPNARSVKNILYDFDFVGWNLHNAGNDAVYTMWIMLATCVREAAGRGKTEVELERIRKLEEEDINVSEEKAREMSWKDHAAWLESEAVNDDGGSGVPVKV